MIGLFYLIARSHSKARSDVVKVSIVPKLSRKWCLLDTLRNASPVFHDTLIGARQNITRKVKREDIR